MKTTKRLLSLLLALALGLALCVPAFAADEADPYAPIITKQPIEYITVREGKKLVLEITAKLPDGIQGKLSYDWFTEFGSEAIASGARASIPITRDMLYGMTGFTYYFNVVVTNTYTDDNGEEQTASITSDTVSARVYPGYGMALAYAWYQLGGGNLFIGIMMLPLSAVFYLAATFIQDIVSFIERCRY